MFKTHNDLSEAIRKKMIELCNDRLADCADLKTQMKQAHWNVKGPSFIALHKLFDEIAEAVEEYVDMIAERAVMLGGVAMGTARLAAENSTLKEYPHNIALDMQHVEAVSVALSSFGKLARKAIETADDEGDKDTADLFTEISRGIDKWLWFVEAQVQK